MKYAVWNAEYGYYCGHKCARRASWKPKFKVRFTQKLSEATLFDSENICTNVATNLFLMGYGGLVGGYRFDAINEDGEEVTVKA